MPPSSTSLTALANLPHWLGRQPIALFETNRRERIDLGEG